MSARRLLLLLLAPIGSATPLAAQAWIRQSPLPTEQSLRSIDFPTPSLGFRAGTDQVLRRTSDGGATWSQMTGFPSGS